ncbi:hypothetical protein [Agrobacterium larrymoorei]|uniref:VWA domain-containing protein n=1 Tax=Agrobacterium larrymoorei TaxID=160699 RepID=A0AAF0KH25_9HYPH|nr:hypothetical protein [Agrobacterium larrymoorei]WHA43992.1 hypothetical protein CFBP5477_023010 [Agrobacterium larrymoorei]
MKRHILSCLLLCGIALPASAQVKTVDEYCRSDIGGPSLRQTLLVIDGSVATDDTPEGPSPNNTAWRRFAAQFFDARNPAIDQMMAPRERITIAIANSDGSGMTPVFTGCIPTVGKEEAAKLEQGTSSMQKFFGNDWRSANTKAAEDFSRSATISLVQGMKSAKIGASKTRTDFSHGGLIQSLNRTKAYSLADGLPRVIIYSDLAGYDLPVSDVATARAKGRADAEAISLDLQRAEINLFSTGKAVSEEAAEYLKAFFLASKSKVETIAAGGGAIATSSVPVKIDIYQGAISLGGNQYPVRMRLARDRNGSVAMSWIEEQSDRTRFSPFSGILNCTDDEKCSFVGDRVFAQIWSDKPGPTPTCEGWMPFGGLRDLSFSTQSDTLTGKISDATCVIVGEEAGMNFQLQKIPNAVF